MKYRKVYLDLLARFSAEGGARPVAFLWEDGVRYEVDRLRFVDRAPARVGSVMPLRYACVVRGRETYLYYEPAEMRWFAEAKE